MGGWRKCFSGKYLWVTNTVTGFTLYALGDLGAQAVELSKLESHKETERFALRSRSKGALNWERAFKMGVMGALLSPWQTGFYIIIDRRFPGRQLAAVSTKVFLDQLNAIPFYACFITCLAFMEGKTWTGSVTHCKETFIPIYMVDLCIWPAAQFFNFYLVRPVFRVTYVNFVTFAWNVILSTMHHK